LYQRVKVHIVGGQRFNRSLGCICRRNLLHWALVWLCNSVT